MQKTKLMMLKFTAGWCAPCRAMKPVLKKFCAAHPDLAFAEVNCEEPGPTGYERSKVMRVNALPTLIIIAADDTRKKPKQLARWAGTCDQAQLEALLLKAQKAAGWKPCPKRKKAAP